MNEKESREKKGKLTRERGREEEKRRIVERNEIELTGEARREEKNSREKRKRVDRRIKERREE